MLAHSKLSKGFHLLTALLALALPAMSAAQTQVPPFANSALRLVFYNAENLFDATDDPQTQDEEFLPTGNKNWTDFRVREKQTNISRVLLSLSKNDEPPALLGLCEVENRAVLEGLAKTELLSPYDYRVVHFDSPDARGIDVGLIFRPARLELLYASKIPVSDPEQIDWKTRDILYAKFSLRGAGDTLHVFINHWPSRRGGEEASRPKRMLAAHALKRVCDSIAQVDPLDGVVIMGDLNDGPGDASLRQGLRTAEGVGAGKTPASGELIDLMELEPKGLGSHKYNGHWEYLDHIAVNEALFSGKRSVVEGQRAHTGRMEWLLVPDDRFTGSKPFRTYEGLKYTGGFSDHLPVYVDLRPLNP